jgi:hypothetical protein
MWPPHVRCNLGGAVTDTTPVLFSGLEPPCLEATGGRVTVADTPKHCIENKRRRRALLASQQPQMQWQVYQGDCHRLWYWRKIYPGYGASRQRQEAGVSDDRLVCHHQISRPLTISDGSKIQVRFMPCTTERSYDILRRVSYES